MSDISAKYAKGAQKAAQQNGGKRDDLPRHDKNDSPKNKRALKTLQHEAAQVGSILASGGKGGLPATEVLGAMRRTGYRCSNPKCKQLGNKQNGGLSMHHLGGIPSNRALSKIGHQNKPANLAPICVKCHDALHTEAKKEGNDSSQVLPAGDKGTNRDHGDKPLAKA